MHADIDVWHGLVPSDERAELVASARRHFAERFPVSRAAFDDPLDTEAGWAQVSRAGYPLVGVPRPAGDGSLADLAALLEEAGRALLPVPLLATVIALQTEIAAGLPVTEESAVVPSALGLAKEGQTSGRVGVLDGAAARRVTVVVPDGDGVVVARLDGARPAEVITHVDPGRPLAMFDLDATAVAARLESGVDGVLARARVAVAADLVGTAAGALDRAVRHALDREQFGRPIGAFQAVKHALANVHLAVERARSLTLAAAVTVADPDADPAEAHTLPLLAKASAAEAALSATDAFVQVLGAMGVTFEADAHLYFRRARQTAPFLGSAGECYRRAVAAGASHETPSVNLR